MEVELSDFQRPKVKWGILPVFPVDPAKTGKKCAPVYDILIGEDGKPKFAQSLYSPSKEFDLEFMRTLQFREYYPATEKKKSVPSLTREVCFSYFYLKDGKETQKVDVLPQSLWAIETRLTKMGTFLDKPLRVELTVDEEGKLVCFKSQIYAQRKLVQRLFKGKKKTKLFTPAYKDGKPVKCKLIQVFGSNEELPDEVYEKVVSLAEKAKTLRNPGIEGETEAKLKLAYACKNCVSYIVAADSGNLDYRQLWTLISRMRYWMYDQYYVTDEDFVGVKIEKEKTPEVVQRRVISLVPGRVVSEAKVENIITQMRVDKVDEIKIDCLIDAQGNVKDVKAYASDNVLLNDELEEAAWTWKYEPSYYDGEAVESTIRISYSFKLTVETIWL